RADRCGRDSVLVGHCTGHACGAGDPRSDGVQSARGGGRGRSVAVTWARRATWGLLLVAACYHPSYVGLVCCSNGEGPRGLSCSAKLICEREDGGIGVAGDAPGVPGIDAAPAPQFLSCAGSVETCGSDNDSCCTTLAIPGGMYYRSYDKAGDSDSGDMQ